MLKSLYTAATGMDAQQTRMDVIANNLANASTTGFKKARAEFDDLLSETVRAARSLDGRGGAAVEVGAGVRLGATTRFFSQGDMVATQSPTDLAIEGDGFFAVERPDGQLAYTRAGAFRVDAAGRLTTLQGDTVEPGFTVPQNATALTVQPDGRVHVLVPGRTDPVDLGQVELATFTNPGGLRAIGGNLLAATEDSGEAQRVRPGEDGAGSLAQGYLEGSNVKAVEEMIDLIVTQRAFEMNSKVIQTGDQMLQRLTNLR
ncbi:MAG: flagellar basal-body rod protein FlgG [Deltaproteobacteria bacterium]|nr:flagellar basal-body rod protein FlgG [Deltaproteobacteria bacterium]